MRKLIVLIIVMLGVDASAGFASQLCKIMQQSAESGCYLTINDLYKIGKISKKVVLKEKVRCEKISTDMITRMPNCKDRP